MDIILFLMDLIFSPTPKMHHIVNDSIKVNSVYQGAIHKNQSDKFLDAKLSSSVKDGDMIVLIIATSGCIHKDIPNDFEIFYEKTKGRGSLSLLLAVGFYADGEKTYRIKKNADDMFVSLISIRGPTMVVDTSSRVGTVADDKLAYTSSLESVRTGAVITSFFYKSIWPPDIPSQTVLTSLVNGWHGFAVGIAETPKRFQSRVRSTTGQGDYVSIAATVF